MTEHPNTDSLRVAAPTTVIKAGDELVTLINVFTVDPTVQRQLLDVLEEATEQVMRHQPGFVSANLHASLDGTQVTNYAQWRRREDFEAMLANPVAREHMDRCLAMADAAPQLYAVASVHHAPDG
jgi:quinol monooxygenase YgiN